MSGSGNTIPDTIPAKWNAYVNVPFGSITGSPTVFLTNTARLRWIKFRNNTDAAVDIVMDGSGIDMLVVPGEQVIMELGANGRDHRGNIEGRYAVGAPTLGTFSITGFS